MRSFQVRTHACAGIGVSITLVLLLFLLQNTTLSGVSAGTAAQVGHWSRFPVREAPGVPLAGVDVSAERIVWAQQDTAPCAAPRRQAADPEIDHDLCAYELRSGQIVTVTADPAMNVWPRTAGEWSVFHIGATAAGGTGVISHATGERFSIPFPGANSGQANVDGEYVVFANTAGSKLHAFALSSRQLITVTTDPLSGLAAPDVAGGQVVWQQLNAAGNYDILGYNLTSGVPITISARAADETAPRIDGGVVVWSAGGNVYGYDLQSSQRLTITEAAGTQAFPVVSGDRVVWMDSRHGNWEIYAYQLSTHQTTRVTESPFDDMYPAVWGDVIAWEVRQSAGQQALGIDAARWMTQLIFLPSVTASSP